MNNRHNMVYATIFFQSLKVHQKVDPSLYRWYGFPMGWNRVFHPCTGHSGHEGYIMVAWAFWSGHRGNLEWNDRWREAGYRNMVEGAVRAIHGWPVMQIVVSKTQSSTVQSARSLMSPLHFSLWPWWHSGSCRLLQHSLSIRGLEGASLGILIPNDPSSFSPQYHKTWAQENLHGSLRALSELHALAWHAACVHSIIVMYMHALACAKLSLACTWTGAWITK